MKRIFALLFFLTAAAVYAGECILSTDGKTVTGVKNKDLIECTVPAGVTVIGKNAFKDCRKLQKVTLPDSVTAIKSYAFANCTALTSFTIPPKVKEIDERAFSACGLTSITIPGGVTEIPYEAFCGCASLTRVVVDAGVTSIGLPSVIL